MITYVTRIAAWLSQGANCILLGGSEDMTVSARCYVNRERPRWRTAYQAINRVFFWQEDHCMISLIRDLEHAEEVVQYARTDSKLKGFLAWMKHRS